MIKNNIKLICLLSTLGSGLSAVIIETGNRAMFSSLTKNTAAVVKFSAVWCGPCRAIRPIYERLSNANEYKDITFLEVDIDKVPTLTERFNIKSIPAFVFLDNGTPVGKPLVGPGENTLKQRLNSLIKK